MLITLRTILASGRRPDSLEEAVGSGERIDRPPMRREGGSGRPSSSGCAAARRSGAAVDDHAFHRGNDLNC